jgi:hypothetical protein
VMSLVGAGRTAVDYPNAAVWRDSPGTSIEGP